MRRGKQIALKTCWRFRDLERLVRKMAEENARCFYAVRPIYLSSSQTPSYFEQVVVHSTKAVDSVPHQKWE